MAHIRAALLVIPIAAIAALAQTSRPGKPAMTRTAATPSPTAAPVASAPAAVMPAAVDWRFAHPNAHFLISVRMRAVLESDAFRGIQAELQKAAVVGYEKAGMEAFLAMFKDIDYVAISVRERPGAKQPDGLILLSGRLQGSPLLSMMKQKSGAPQVHFAAPDTVLVGDTKDVQESLSRLRDAGSPIAGELTARARRMAGDYDVWMSGRTSILARAVADQPKAGEFLSGLSALSFGLTLQDPPVMLLTLAASQPAALTRIAGRYVELERQMSATPSGRAQWEQLSRLVEMEQDGNEVRFRVTGEPGKLSADIGALSQALKPHLNSLRSSPRREPEPEVPSRNTIVIQGLEGGTREIPFRR